MAVAQSATMELTTILKSLSLTLGLLGVALAAPSNTLVLTPNSPVEATSTQPSVISLIRQYFPVQEQERAISVALCESRLKNVPTYKYDGKKYTAYGIFQINKTTEREFCPDLDRTDISENIQCAARIREIQGNWSDWDESKSCWSN